MKNTVVLLLSLTVCFDAYGMALFGGPKSEHSVPISNRAKGVGSMDNAHRDGMNKGYAKTSGKYWYSNGKDKTSCLPRRLTNQISAMGKYFGKPVKVVSAYRAPADNARRGGAKGSTHKTCKAVDFQIPGISRARIRGYLDALHRTGKWGIGYYCNDRFHLDVGNKRTWGGCHSRAIKHLVKPKYRKTAVYQSVHIPNSAVTKTTPSLAPSSQYQRVPTSADSVD